MYLDLDMDLVVIPDLAVFIDVVTKSDLVAIFELTAIIYLDTVLDIASILNLDIGIIFYIAEIVGMTANLDLMAILDTRYSTYLRASSF